MTASIGRLLRSAAAAACLGALTSLPGTAVARDLVVFASEDPQGASLNNQDVGRAYRWQFGAGADPDLLDLSQLLAGYGKAQLLGQVAPEPCAGEATAPAAFDELVARASGSVAYVDHADAAEALRLAHGSLACLTGPVSPDSLSRYYFLRGMVAFHQQGPAAARREFRAGLLVSPFLQWDPLFPPDAMPSFEAALADALKADRAFLSISPGTFDGGRVWLDGVKVDPRTRTTPIFAGVHLIQWAPERGPFRTFAAGVAGGADAELVTTQDLASNFVSRTGSRIQLDFVEGLVRTGREAGSGALVTAQPGPVVLFHRREPGQEEWKLADLAAGEARIAGARRTQTAGGVLIAAGVASAVVGAVLAGTAAAESSSIHARLFSGSAAGASSADFEALSPLYAAQQDQGRAGWALAISGGVLTSTGIPIVIGGVRSSPPRLRGRRAAPEADVSATGSAVATEPKPSDP